MIQPFFYIVVGAIFNLQWNTILYATYPTLSTRPYMLLQNLMAKKGHKTKKRKSVLT